MSTSVPDLSQFMDNTYGALLIGTLIATFVSGMNTLQTILYYRLYPEDSSRLKVLVGFVLCLDLAHTALLWVDLWFFFIENFGNPSQVDIIQKPLIVPGAVVVGMILTFIVHMFYLRRVYDLSHRNYWISIPILILIIGYSVSAIALIAVLYRYRLLSVFAASSDAWLLSIGFCFTAATDILIMTSLFVLLRASRKRSISLNNAIDQMILYTLEMGSLTAFMAIAIMITWFVQLKQNSLIFLAIYLSLAKAYGCSFLGSLNSRYQLRNSQNSQASGRNMARVANVTYPSHQQSQRTETSSVPSQIASQILAPKRRPPSPELLPNHIHVDVTRRIWDDELPR